MESVSHLTRDWNNYHIMFNYNMTKKVLTIGLNYGKDALGNGLWVAVGDGSFIAHSPDGNNWYSAKTTGGVTYGSGVAFNRILYDGVDF